MAETTIILGDWNSITPAAPGESPGPAGDNINFAVDRTGAIPKFSAWVPRATTEQYGTVLLDESSGVSVAVFLIGIGAAVGVDDDVAPVYRVKKAGTITRFAAKAKAALGDDAVFMVQRRRLESPESVVDILTDNLTISNGSIAWHETTAFDNSDLAIGDELLLNIISGSPKDVTLELYWS